MGGFGPAQSGLAQQRHCIGKLLFVAAQRFGFGQSQHERQLPEQMRDKGNKQRPKPRCGRRLGGAACLPGRKLAHATLKRAPRRLEVAAAPLRRPAQHAQQRAGVQAASACAGRSATGVQCAAGLVDPGLEPVCGVLQPAGSRQLRQCVGTAFEKSAGLISVAAQRERAGLTQSRVGKLKRQRHSGAVTGFGESLRGAGVQGGGAERPPPCRLNMRQVDPAARFIVPGQRLQRKQSRVLANCGPHPTLSLGQPPGQEGGVGTVHGALCTQGQQHLAHAVVRASAQC